MTSYCAVPRIELYGVTVDFDSLDDDAVTIRDRDTMEQERVKINQLAEQLSDSLEE